MEIRLDDKVALVTGASRGIGEAVARAFAEAGASVMLSSRKQDALEEVAADLRDGTGADVDVFAANAGEPEQAEACVEATVERFGGVDILVNNAATNPYFGRAIGIDLPRYDKTMQVNLRGPLVWTQAVWAASMQERGGVVLNMASLGGLVSEPFLGIYNVTKAGLIHLTRTLALDMAPGVRVNALAPGVVKTDFARALWEPGGEELAKSMPLGRIGVPEDIANASLFLCSDMASWITGQVLVIDGGAMIRPNVN
jgi:NAD(P)-dependent dehydrogenase (short-subunit alcohol dehydrogenase family)